MKKESSASFKAMRQIHFENDSSNHSTGESPSSFLSEPGRAVDSSIPKPTVNRPKEFSEEAEGIEILKVVEPKPKDSLSIESSSANIFPRQALGENETRIQKWPLYVTN